MSPILQFWKSEALKGASFSFDAPRVGDAGFDLRALSGGSLEVGEQALVSTGLHLAIPLGWVGIVKDRSSMAARGVYTHGGVIDASYRGEVRIILSNRGRESFVFESGARIAQLVVVPHLYEATEVSSITDLGATNRGDGGFGSTGQ